MRIDPNDLRGRDVYQLMISLLVPRPIAWTGTRSPEGIDNLAPFSYFMGVTSKPPSLAISVARKRGGALKDSCRNILESGEFTVSIVSADLAGPMVRSSAPWASDLSEFEVCKLTPRPGERVAAPFPAEARAAMECRLIHAHDLGTAHLLVGQVLLFHVDDAVLDPDHLASAPRVDAVALDPLARLGGDKYTRLGPIETWRPPRLGAGGKADEG